MSLSILLMTAVVTGFVHTIAGPDHYLPFIAIAKSRNYGLGKTLFWTFLCGLGHIGSALLLALCFLLFARVFSKTQMEWIEEWRGSIAAYALVGMGAAILIHALFNRWKKRAHKHVHLHLDGSVTVHRHDMIENHDHDRQDEKNLSYWVIFLIFIFGPCEALLPLLTASAVLGPASVAVTTIAFSLVTIITMLTAVILGLLGINALRFHWIERYASETAGVTVMLCGLMILCFGL